MVRTIDKVPEYEQFRPEVPDVEYRDPLVVAGDGVSEVQDGFLQSTGFRSGVAGWRMQDNGEVEIQRLTLGTKTIALSAGQSLQAALDDLASEGGGIIQLGAGTHLFTGNITLPVKTPIRIEGENMTSTVISFGSTTNRIIAAGTGMYTTGTVSITSGVTVTGSSTNWLSSGLVAGDQIFLDSRWYQIAAIGSNTSITLSEGYGGAVLAGASYRAGKIITDIEIKEVTITGSTSTSGALDVDDARNFLMEDVQLVGNNKGIVATNLSEWQSNRCAVVSSTSDGVTLSTGSLINNTQLVTVANGGHGVVASSIKTSTFEFSSSTGNTTDGYNLTSCTDISMSPQASANGGQGIECVSGNDNILIANGLIAYNTSDGIKLTATSDNCRISACKINNNGGYGLNIAASTCDNNVVTTSVFSTNTSGAVNNSGTGTVVKANVGVADAGGTTGHTITTGTGSVNYNTSTIADITVTVPAGQKVTGGGYTLSHDTNQSAYQVYSYPPADNQWRVRVASTQGTTSVTVTAYAISIPGV
jgi:hypothetical protein